MLLALSQYNDDGAEPWQWDVGWGTFLACMGLAVCLIAAAIWTLLTRR
jgi:hypothetical protein